MVAGPNGISKLSLDVNTTVLMLCNTLRTVQCKLQDGITLDRSPPFGTSRPFALKAPISICSIICALAAASCGGVGRDSGSAAASQSSRGVAGSLGIITRHRRPHEARSGRGRIGAALRTGRRRVAGRRRGEREQERNFSCRSGVGSELGATSCC